MGYLVGHAVVDEFVGVDEEFVFDGLVVPASHGGGVTLAAAFERVFPIMDNHRHGRGDTTREAGSALYLGAHGVVGGVIGVALSPFGFDEDAFAGGVAGEGLVEQLIPHLFHLCCGGGIAVLVCTD